MWCTHRAACAYLPLEGEVDRRRRSGGGERGATQELAVTARFTPPRLASRADPPLPGEGNRPPGVISYIHPPHRIARDVIQADRQAAAPHRGQGAHHGRRSVRRRHSPAGDAGGGVRAQRLRPCPHHVGRRDGGAGSARRRRRCSPSTTCARWSRRTGCRSSCAWTCCRPTSRPSRWPRTRWCSWARRSRW